MFPIWKSATGLKVYDDSQAIPYSVSYYNWLFYFVYGGTAKIIMGLFSLDISSLPAVTRLLSLGFATATIGVVYKLLGLLAPAQLASCRWLRLAGSTLLIINPLTGSWLYTARPDVAAIFCELAGLWWALKYAANRNTASLRAAAIAGLAAWSFKQNFIHLLGGLFVFIALRRQWRDLGLLSLAGIGVACGTLLIGGHDFRHALIGAQMNCQMSPSIAWGVFQLAAGKAPQLVAILAGLCLVAAIRMRWPTTASQDLIALMSAIAVSIAFLGVLKQGADTNYFIAPSLFGTLWGISLLSSKEDGILTPRNIRGLLPWAIVALFGFGILDGIPLQARQAARTIARCLAPQPADDRRDADAQVAREIAKLKRHLKELPGPTFVNNRACNLPWVQTKAPHFVYSFMYALDRKAGLPFAQGGIGGLIAQGFFETVVVEEQGCACESLSYPPRLCSHLTMQHLPLSKNGEIPSVDGEKLILYRLAFRDGWFTYYRKRSQ